MTSASMTKVVEFILAKIIHALALEVIQDIVFICKKNNQSLKGKYNS